MLLKVSCFCVYFDDLILIQLGKLELNEHVIMC